MSRSILEVNNLKTCFGQGKNVMPAVDGIDFKIDKGKTFVLLGESGCGKSVTALSIMRLLPPSARITSGSVNLDDDINLFELPENRMRDIRGGRIAMIFQEPQSSLNPVMTAGQQIGETLGCHKNLKGQQQRERTIELLDAVGIPEPQRRIDEYPHQFSGGMKQRIMIAIALAGEPDLLIADEPTTALDVTIQAQILTLLKKLQSELNMAMLFITHDLGVTSEIADHVAVMYEGKIVENNTRDAFFSGPQHEYSRHLFEMVPSKAKRDKDRKVNIREAQGDEDILVVKDLKVYYPIQKGLFKKVVGYVRALDGVTIEIKKGQTLAIVGESGSGKTTMGKGILQLIKPTSGSVNYLNYELTRIKQDELRTIRSDIQVIFQDPYSSMNPRMMISEIIEEGMLAQNIGAEKKERMQRVDELLLQVGLDPEHKTRYPHEFSGGQRQRICIARALAVDPKLIVCDEPTSALDVSIQSQILELLIDLQDRLGLTYLFITHNISVVEYLAHTVAVMHDGKIVEQGDVNDVLYNPQHDYTKKLLSAVPKIRTGT